jgi:hypothetical protein
MLSMMAASDSCGLGKNIEADLFDYRYSSLVVEPEPDCIDMMGCGYTFEDPTLGYCYR